MMGVCYSTIFHTQCGGMFKIYLCIIFHMLSSNGSEVIAIKPKDKENVYMITMLLFYMIQKHWLNKYGIVCKNILPCIISGLF